MASCEKQDASRENEMSREMKTHLEINETCLRRNKMHLLRETRHVSRERKTVVTYLWADCSWWSWWMIKMTTLMIMMVFILFWAAIQKVKSSSQEYLMWQINKLQNNYQLLTQLLSWKYQWQILYHPLRVKLSPAEWRTHHGGGTVKHASDSL